MRGSENQIKWAEEIKESWTDTRKARLVEAVTPKMKPEYMPKLIEAVNRIETIDDAAWWIDNKEALQCHSGSYQDIHLKLAMGLIPAAAKKLGMV